MKNMIVVFTFILCFGAATATFAEAAVSFNKASAAEIVAGLEGLVDETLAQAIVDYRAVNGPFKQPEDMLKVPGMRPVIYNSIVPVKKGDDVVYEDDMPTGMHSY